MKIQTLSVVVGSRACNAKCPFCISKMTGLEKIPPVGQINWNNLEKAILLAERAGTTTVLLTGKGEPTLYPKEILAYLEELRPRFPLIEIQTNGLDIGRLARVWKHGADPNQKAPATLTDAMLRKFRDGGLNTIALSVVGVDPRENAEVYCGSADAEYPDLATTVEYLHHLGFTVRLCVMMKRSNPDNSSSWGGNVLRARLDAMNTIDFCREHKVDQLTLRPIRRPSHSENLEASSYVVKHGLEQNEIDNVRNWVVSKGTKLMSLMHGAEVFDVDGQNVCLSDCLTIDSSSSDIRTLIFYSDGRLTYDWQYDGAVLLGGY